MGKSSLLLALSVLLMVTSANAALAQSASLPQRLELERRPWLRPLYREFADAPTPGYELLRLPTFRDEAVWWELGRLTLRSSTEVAPALELDCRLTCQTMLEQTGALELRLELGGGETVPAMHLFVRNEVVVVPHRTFRRSVAGFGGSF